MFVSHVSAVAVTGFGLTPMNSVRCQMVYESWREQVKEGEQKTHQAEIGKVFLIDRGEEQRAFFCQS